MAALAPRRNLTGRRVVVAAQAKEVLTAVKADGELVPGNDGFELFCVSSVSERDSFELFG